MYRFAPYITSELTINKLRIALFNYICASQNGEQFIVRFENTNQDKNSEEKDKEILEILEIFGIKYDGLYYQSENVKYHLQFASSLMDKKKAFACFCTDEELEKSPTYSGKCLNITQEEILNNNLPFTIRIKKPDGSISFEDSIKGKLTFDSNEVDSFIIMTKEKYPTYNFACATDDMIQGIKYVIREENHIKNTPKQEHIRRALGYHEPINYTHIPALLNCDNISVKSLLDEGFLPEAITNYLILLEMDTPKKIFSLSDTFKFFDIKKLTSSKKEFDIEKLKDINKEHIKRLSDIELSKIIGYSCATLGALAKLFTKECSTTLEIKLKIDKIFSQKSSFKFEDDLKDLKDIIKNAPYFENFDDFFKYLKEKTELSDKDLLEILEFLILKDKSSINLEKIYPFIKNYLMEIAR
jgi:glutamyl-tRNA synthetase